MVSTDLSRSVKTPDRLVGARAYLRSFAVTFLEALIAVLTVVWPLALYLSGIAYWLRSFWFANLTALDWRLSLGYQSILEQAIRLGRIPYASTLDHYTNRYLGTPETPLSPQFLLLPWVNGWAFNVLNLCFLYSVGFAGLWLIKRRYALSWFPFTVLFLLFNFGGCIVPRVALGHTMWYGYFFLPFLFLCLFDILEGRNGRRAVYLLAGVLFLMELQGSFHMIVWCSMFLGLVAIFDVRRFVPIVKALVLAYALCAFRFAPTAVSLHKLPLEYLETYPSLGTFLDGLTVLPRPVWLRFGRFEGWADMDCYVGFAGLALLVGFGWVYPYRDKTARVAVYWPLYPAILAMVALSMSPVWEHVYRTGVPLLSSQRIPARFSLIVVTAAVMLAVPYMQKFLDDARRPGAMKRLLPLTLIPLSLGLHAHSSAWRVEDVEVTNMDKITTYLPVSLLTPDMADDPTRLYVHVLWASAAFSLGVALLWCIGCWRACRIETP